LSRVTGGASCTLVAVSLIVVAALVVVTSSTCQLPQAEATGNPYGLLAERPRDADELAGILRTKNAGSAEWSADAPDGNPVLYVPLVFARLPLWSGDARFGYAVCNNDVDEYNYALLHADWYVRYPGFDADPPPLPDLEFVQIIRLQDKFWPPSEEAVEEYAKYRPGTLWLIGNEPETHTQDCVTPGEYAQIYHHWYNIIKAADPYAKVGIGGVVQATPLRLRYLDLVLQKYERRYGSKIPVDVWNVHGFILREKVGDWGCQIPCGLSATEGELYGLEDHDNMTIFKDQIVRFRQWMKDNGERNKPLIVSEYGILFPEYLGYDRARVEAFMLATFDYFRTAKSSSLGYPADGNRLVQAWNWFSLDRPYGPAERHSHLFDPDTKQITSLGTAYGNYTASH
jgi:hypothetical protein